MWPYVLCSLGISALFSLSLPLYGVTEVTIGVIDMLSQCLLLAVTIGFAAFALLKRTKSRTSSATEDAEFVGNIPVEWKLDLPSDLAAIPPRPKLPPQSIFFPRARLGGGFARNLAEQTEQRAEQQIARC